MSDSADRIAFDGIPHVEKKNALGIEDAVRFAHGRFLIGNKHQAKLANDRVE